MGRKSKNNDYCVYVHINKINGKMYVGQSRNLYERWRSNGKNYAQCRKFFNAIKKYGWDNFIHAIIKDSMFIDEADAVEKELIETFDTINNGYNLKEGGARGELSPESLKKMGDGVHRAFTEHPEIIEKIRIAHIGLKMSEESKRKISLNGARTILINIDGEVGSFRYWAKRIGTTHIPLVHRKKKGGIESVITYIREMLKQQAA